MDWTPCTPLTAESDYWDADQVAIRRRLSGVAQGVEDLRAVAVHFKRDPDEAVAAWETHARAADDDGMATFNAFVREWRGESPSVRAARYGLVAAWSLGDLSATIVPATDAVDRLNKLLSGLSFVETEKFPAINMTV